MIRFMPDSWVDVLLRPLDMISPEGNIYVEVPAPDIRLAAALLLAFAVLATAWRRRSELRPAFLLLALTLLAMVPWLATTGNGRYFIPFLLLLGPLCVGLVRLLPLSGSMKFSAVGLLLLVQGVLVFEASPWGTWTLLPWRDGRYFEVAAPPAEPRSYVTLSPISYSLMAPLFPAESRWMNLSAPVTGRERDYARKWLAQAKALHLIAVAYPAQMEADGGPSPAVLKVFDRMMRPRGLSLAPDAPCEFLASPGLAGIATRGKGLSDKADPTARFGFWMCPLKYDPAAAADLPGAPPDHEDDAVFEVVEKLCPRFFPPGQAVTQAIDGGATRHYTNSDTRLFVLDGGEVMYKFWRSLNPVLIGNREGVLAGQARIDCTKIRAPTWRSGGP